MRIVIITDAWEPQVNGVVRTYQNIIREFKGMGHDVKIISPQDFKTIPLPFYKEISLAFFPRFKMTKMIEEFAPDSVHIAVEGPLGWSARKYCRNNNKLFTTSFHTHFPDYIAKRSPRILANSFRRATISILRHFHSASKTIYVATQSLEDELRSWGFSTKMVRLTRGVDLDVFYPAPSQDKKTIPTLLYVGRVAIEKNIEAFLNLKIPSHKIVVGIGPALDSLKKKYPHVEFAGLQEGENLADFYRRADCFVFPSKTDTFGIVLIEALACGIAVAGYNVTGPKDIITDPRLGAVNDDLETAVQNALDYQDHQEFRHTFVKNTYSWVTTAQTFIRPHLSP